VCTADLGKVEAGRLRRCSTCARLAVDGDAPAEVISAAYRAAGEERRASRRSRIARDHSHSIVELDLGLSRKTVVVLRHGEGEGDLVAESVVRHSLLGSKRRS
jgi:hypothetical protein